MSRHLPCILRTIPSSLELDYTMCYPDFTADICLLPSLHLLQTPESVPCTPMKLRESWLQRKPPLAQYSHDMALPQWIQDLHMQLSLGIR